MKEVTHFVALGQDEDRKPFSFAINAESLIAGLNAPWSCQQDRKSPGQP